MNTTKYLSLAALALMGTLASCQSDDELTIARPDNAVGINVTVGSLQGITRSNPASTDPDEAKNFNQGDQVCVSTDGQDPVLFQCQDADQQTWAEAVSGKFLLWTASEMTFKAYYPATDGTSMTAFTLPADQSTEAKIALADYMTRQQNCSNGSGTDINLELERKMARVIVKIAGFTNQYRDDQKTVSNVRINSQYSAIANDNGTGDITAVTPYMQGTGGVNTTYTALVVPGYDDSSADFITLTDGENNTLKVKGIPELEAGNSYTFNLTVGKNKILVQSVTVTDWTTGETLAGGQAQEQGGASTPTLSLTSPAVGQVIGSDGKNYAYGSLPTGVTAVAKICYVSGSNGLALALTDEGEMMDWSTAQTTCAAHTPAFTGGTWKLASQDEWDNMISTAGSQTDLRDGFSSVGGTNMQQNCYWSSKEKDTDNAWLYYFGNGQGYWNDDEKGYGYYVRACLAFTVEQGSASVPVTAITLNKTETSIKVGSTETLSVTAVAPDNATDKTYTWKTSDATKATVDQDGKVTAVAEGTVTIYAEANDGSGVKGNCTVTVTPATITVTWNNNDITSASETSFTKDGVTITAGIIDFNEKNFMGGGTFTTTRGNFTKIEVTTSNWAASGTGWSGSTWTGNASSVSFDGDIYGEGMGNTMFVFTIQPTN